METRYHIGLLTGTLLILAILSYAYYADYNYRKEIIEKKFSQQNKVLGNIEKFAENQGLQTFFFNEKVS